MHRENSRRGSSRAFKLLERTSLFSSQEQAAEDKVFSERRSPSIGQRVDQKATVGRHTVLKTGQCHTHDPRLELTHAETRGLASIDLPASGNSLFEGALAAEQP